MQLPATSRTFIRVFLALVLAWAGAFNALSIWLEPVSGDLARIGSWPERDFGGHGPARSLPIRANGDPAAPPPTVLVIGDSFSNSNVWQTAFAAETGEEPLTCSYWTAGSLARWIRWASHRAARVWVLQVVERNLVTDWGTLGRDAPGDPWPLPIAAGQTAGRRPRVAWNPDYGYLARAGWNHLRLDDDPPPLESGETTVAALTRSDMFTNRRADRLLYFSVDARKEAWTDEELADVEATLLAVEAAARSAGARLLPVLVPDKSTTYAPWMVPPAARPRYETLITRWRTLGLRPVDVLAALRAALPGTRDLYGPDDSHFGPDGQRTLAAAVARAVVSSGRTPTRR